MKRNIGFWIVLSAVFIAEILNVDVFAEEKKEKSFLSFEFEMMRFTNWSNTNNVIFVARAPLEIRTVPTHRDDPYVSLDPIQDMKPLSLNEHKWILDVFNLKLCFFSTIGVGVGIRASGYELESDFPSSMQREERFNYAPYYGPSWGAAYIVYRVGVSEESKGNSFSLRYFLELQTPTINLGGEKEVNVGLFGGYDLSSDKIVVYACNGWDRWGSFEQNKSWTLGELRVHSYYGGVYVNNGSAKFRFFITKDSRKVMISELGRESGLSFQDTPFLFGLSAGFQFNFNDLVDVFK